MLNFIVLGIIPGTHTQLNFYLYMSILSVLIGVIVMISTIRMYRAYRYITQLFIIDSISL